MRNHRLHSRAFTLVELLICLGISLLLLYGINLVFRAVTEVVRTGNALANASRKMRGVESAFVLDFEGTFSEYDVEKKAEVQRPQIEARWSGIVPVIGSIESAATTLYEQQPRQPAITIFCKRQIAFMNAADKEADTDDGVAATFDESDNGTITDFSQSNQMARLGNRAHRIDTIGFFTGGSFAPSAVRDRAKPTGDAPQAWVWYGHLLQHNSRGDLTITKFDELKPYDYSDNAGTLNANGGNPGRFFPPGEDREAGNVRNLFATDWILGRVAMTLAPRKNSTTTHPGYPTLGTSNGKSVYRVFAETLTAPTAIDSDAREVEVTAGVGSTYAPPGPPAVDLDSIPADPLLTPAQNPVPFTSGLNAVVGIWPGNLSFGPEALLPTGSVGTSEILPYNPDLFNGLVRRYSKIQTDPATKNFWWARSMVQGSTLANPVPELSSEKLWYPMRFDTVKAFTEPVAREGLLGADEKIALQSSFLAQGCTQFIVEFAGDFVTQAANGTVSPATITPDGVLDFAIDANGNRQTQWYGLPRDVDGNGVIDPTDVVPICRKISPAATAEIANSIEKKFLPDLGVYLVAFGPNDMYPATKLPKDSIRPQLIRLTVTLNDSAGNLPTGLTREFVFKVR